jgi:hypothetical protein
MRYDEGGVVRRVPFSMAGAVLSLFFKEYLKLRRVLVVLFLAFAGVIVYTFIMMSAELRVLGAGMVWDSVVQKGIVHFDGLRYLFLGAGVLGAVAQYTPEMVNKRLKLTLHLPLREGRIVLLMLLFGVGCLVVLFLLVYVAVCVGVSRYYPVEVTRWNLGAMLPWLWGGVAGYLLTAWVTVEPVWRQRVWNGVVSLCLLRLFYFDVLPGAYGCLLPVLVGCCGAGVLFVFYSVARFKEGY